MFKKKKESHQPVPPDAEVLKAVRALPQTTRSRFYLYLMPQTVNESLIHCLSALGRQRGEDFQASTELQLAATTIAVAITTGKYVDGYLFCGKSGSGKTSMMLAINEFLTLLRKFPTSWKYNGINSIESLYVNAEDFQHPSVLYEINKVETAIPVLLVDNLGYEIDGVNSQVAVKSISKLIMERYGRGLLTFISTPFDIQSIREIYGSRVASIISENYHIEEFECNTFRKGLCYEEE